MRKMLLFFLSLFFLLSFLLGSFSNNSFYLKKIIDKKNSKSNLPINNLNSYMYNYDSQVLGISDSELSYILDNLNSYSSAYNPMKLISKKDAISDINFLFKLIKYSYAGFQYFGGSSTFDVAQKKIIDTINSHPDKKIMLFQFENILYSNLAFLQDSHFTINNNSPILKYNYYSNESVSIYKDYKGYYVLNNNKKYYIKSINFTKEFEKYLKLSLDTKGDFCYIIGVLQSSEEILKELTLEIDLITNEQIYSIPLTMNSHNTKVSKGYNLYYKNEIPIVSIDRMYNIDDTDDTVNNFINSANLVKSNPILIIDLRGNSGGQDVAGISWFENYTGFTPKINQNILQLNSLLNNQLTKKYSETIDVKKLTPELQNELNEELLAADCKTNKWNLSTEVNTNSMNNTNLIFILIDSSVASSGEAFVQFLQTLDNVILVGTNTSGSLLSNNFMNMALPNSALNINFGNKLTENYNFTEGIGLEPDIWINDTLILDKVLSLIESLN